MAELFPPEGDPKLAESVFDILDEIIKDKVAIGLHKKWNRGYKLSRGKHWENKQSIPLTKANLVYRHINQTCNQLTDNNPTFNISRSGDPNAQNQEVYDGLQRAASHWWIDQEQQDVLESSVRNGETYGIAIEKVVFNPDLEYGMGEVETVIVDPFHFGFYPTKLKDPRELQKSDAVFHYYPMSVREARRKWPEFAAQIKSDEEIIKELGDDRRDINAEAGKPRSMMVSLASVAKEILNWKTGESGEGEELVIVEAWVHDYTMEKVQHENVVEAVGEEVIETEIIEEKFPKYPGNIRYIVACNGKITLEDRPNPNINFDVLTEEQAQMTYLYDKYPFCAVNSVRDTSSAWGQDDVEQLDELNMEFNKALSQLVLEKDRAVRRKYINPKNSGVPNDHFTNFISILNPINEKVGDGIRVLDYPAIPVDVQNAITLFKDLFFLVSATFELDQAQLGSNQLAYKSIAALIERVATMMRGKIRAYGRLVRERGRMYLSHVQNFYTEDRWITYEDENGIQTSGKINGTQMLVPAKLTVVSGSTLPTSKVQQREEALALYDKQAIDRQELLSSLEWSGRAEVIKRMNSGVIGTAVENLGKIGMPQELMQMFAQILSMDPKEVDKGVKAGEIPPFQAIMESIIQMMQGQEGQQTDPVQDAEMQERNAKAKQAYAAAEKAIAERDLIVEKTLTERVDQQVKLAGMNYDEEELKMRRAEIVSGIENEARKEHLEGMKAGLNFVASAQKNRPGFNEKGIKSDNVRQ